MISFTFAVFNKGNLFSFNFFVITYFQLKEGGEGREDRIIVLLEFYL